MTYLKLLKIGREYQLTNAKEKGLRREAIRAYKASISFVDEQIGKVLNQYGHYPIQKTRLLYLQRQRFPFRRKITLAKIYAMGGSYECSHDHLIQAESRQLPKDYRHPREYHRHFSNNI